MARTPVGMFGHGYEGITEFVQKTEKTRRYIDDLQKEFIYWFDGGGALTKRVADSLVQRMRNDIYSQEAFAGFPPLSEFWEQRKDELGLDPRVGIATGDMANSIEAINQRYRRYKVGISSREISISPGNVEKVVEYAKMLEEGWQYMNQAGELVTQPPRPFFSRTFLRWTKDTLPQDIKDTIFDRMERQLQAIHNVVAYPKPPYHPQDIYYIYHNPYDDLGY